MMTLEQAMLAISTGFGCFFIFFLIAALYVAIMLASGRWLEVEEEEVVTEPVNRKGAIAPWKRAGFKVLETYDDPSRAGKMVIVMTKTKIVPFKGMR